MSYKNISNTDDTDQNQKKYNNSTNNDTDISSPTDPYGSFIKKFENNQNDTQSSFGVSSNHYSDIFNTNNNTNLASNTNSAYNNIINYNHGNTNNNNNNNNMNEAYQLHDFDEFEINRHTEPLNFSQHSNSSIKLPKTTTTTATNTDTDNYYNNNPLPSITVIPATSNINHNLTQSTINSPSGTVIPNTKPITYNRPSFEYDTNANVDNRDSFISTTNNSETRLVPPSPEIHPLFIKRNPTSNDSYINDGNSIIHGNTNNFDEVTSIFNLNGDLEGGPIEQQGDDYPINSYINKQGNMVNPYSQKNTFINPETYQMFHTNTHDNVNRNLSLAYKGRSTNKSPSRNKNLEQHFDLGEYSNSNKNNSRNFANSSYDNEENDGFNEDDEYDIDSQEGSYEYETEDEDDSSTHTSLTKKYSATGETEYEAKDDDTASSKVLSVGKKGFPQRLRTVRRFLLDNGNFVFDCPLSESLLSNYAKSVDDPSKLSNEFKFMRYQAVTCEPHLFSQENFTLRQLKFLVPRRTELFIVITMYNEDEILLSRTLKGVFDNIRHTLKKKNSLTWGADAWKKIVVCIVSDGRSKINPRSLALLSALGCYQDGFAKSEINGKQVITHVYEHTTKVNIASVDENGVQLVCDQTTVPVQLLFCLKENNQKKINSHRWAIEAFAESLQPNVIVLLDAGTKPGKDSIYELWKEFEDPQVGGACGEIRVDLGGSFKDLFNPLVAAQNFEYKLSNILDKTTESNFGFITVLPGAFSAYRFEALKGEPLQKYFMGDNMQSIKLFLSNMYLAEDRILCFEIVTKKQSNWVLRYCRSSYGETDVPSRIPEFILQRRRWMNGSFFASLYSFVHCHKIWTSGQSFLRKIGLTIESLYLFFNTLISWFSLSSFFLVFRILTLSIAISYYDIVCFRILSMILYWLYCLTLLTTFILSLGNKPKGTPTFYLIVFIFFAILFIYVVFCSIYLSVNTVEDVVDEDHVTFTSLMKSEPFRDLIVSMGSTYVLYFASSVIALQPWHMFTSFIQYLLLSPSYINVLNIYAFANVHDISWGTKGSVAAKSLGKVESKKDGSVKTEIPISAAEIENNYQKFIKELSTAPAVNSESEPSLDEKKTSYYAMVRSIILIVWSVSNFAVVAVVLEIGSLSEFQNMQKDDTKDVTSTVTILGRRSTIYFSVILWLVAAMAAIRFIGCSLYMLKRSCKKLFTRRQY
ncbi:related to Chitin synthase 1 [Saccharomycodes ludwigii]|uniref:chitin synthase n=1 Tax=Saccharomycodes ludwigii TaxID=36035 RepID=A0A376B8F8_9ASCO|nr:related to Chitin synthase 1 [Saccharomycodes ludwigii]